MTWETVIGLEVHVQLNTKSKLFSGASTAFGAEPNAHASLVECAMPGVLPVMNREVVNKAIKLGFALDAKINQKNIFDRKNYFYPDLPKAYHEFGDEPAKLSPAIQAVLTIGQPTLDDYDAVLTF